MNEKIVVQEPKPILGVCEQCNHPIYETSNLNRVNESFVVGTGRTNNTETRQRVLCNGCNEIRLMEEEREAEQRQRKINAAFKKRRIHSFIWPSLIALLFIAVGISFFVPRLYTVIAFDSGGVASGPLTSSFISIAAVNIVALFSIVWSILS